MYENINLLQLLLLKAIAFIYLSSFTSWYIQIPSLYGQNGLLPVRHFIHKVPTNKFQEFPTLLLYADKLNITHETMLYLICLFGIIFSLFPILTKKALRLEIYFILWLLYQSLVQVGQIFTQFQWDILLLEAGFIAIFFTPCYSKNTQYTSSVNIAARELLRWLSFRLYFSSGLLKLLSGCPTWWNLTALHHHFSSQCIPHHLAWWAHQLPSDLKKFMVAGQFIVLIFGGIGLYFPTRNIRIFSFLLQTLMQLSIISTGNYNFFNFLSIIMTAVVLDDDFLLKYVPKTIFSLLGLKKKEYQQNRYIQPNVLTNFQWVVESSFCIGLVGFIMMTYFPIDQKLSFTEKDIKLYLHLMMQYRIYFYASALYFIYYLLLFYIQNHALLGRKQYLKPKYVLKLLFSFFLFFGLFTNSIQAFKSGLSIKDNNYIISDQKLISLYQRTYPFHLSSSYGLFRRMTGVGGRPELIFQGSNDGENWEEYEFHYKPGKVQEIPGFIMPHQPRLDWQLWFAALTDAPNEQWLIHLVYKMLINSKHLPEYVIHNPFPDRAPKYLRIQKYKYKFTNLQQWRKTNNFWKREFEKEYLQAVTIDSLRDIQKQLKFPRKEIEEEHILSQLNPVMIVIVIVVLNYLVH